MPVIMCLFIADWILWFIFCCTHFFSSKLNATEWTGGTHLFYIAYRFHKISLHRGRPREEADHNLSEDDEENGKTIIGAEEELCFFKTADLDRRFWGRVLLTSRQLVGLLSLVELFWGLRADARPHTHRGCLPLQEGWKHLLIVSEWKIKKITFIHSVLTRISWARKELEHFWRQIQSLLCRLVTSYFFRRFLQREDNFQGAGHPRQITRPILDAIIGLLKIRWSV